MHSRSTVDLALLLSSLGILDRENADICGVSIHTLRHWRHGDRRRLRDPLSQGGPNCPRCHQRPLEESTYAYLLGLYLGDGHIVHARTTYLLSIACSDCWPGLIQEAKQAVKGVMPSSSVFLKTRPGKACTYVQSVSKHWPCLFPQHGPGMKHTRRIELDPWQQEIVTSNTGNFVRGLLHSDGCRSTNRVRRPCADGDHWYEYPRYFFDNKSADILRLCGEALDALDVAWRFSKPTTISVARRDAVARLDQFVGPKH